MTIYRFFFMKKYTDSEQDVNGYSEWVAATTVKEATLFDFFFYVAPSRILRFSFFC